MNFEQMSSELWDKENLTYTVGEDVSRLEIIVSFPSFDDFDIVVSVWNNYLMCHVWEKLSGSVVKEFVATTVDEVLYLGASIILGSQA